MILPGFNNYSSVYDFYQGWRMLCNCANGKFIPKRSKKLKNKKNRKKGKRK